MTPEILHFASLPSTNLEAARRARAGAAEGTCIVADEQTAGRGRRQRRWVSPPGAGLYFSIVLRPQLEPGDWPLLTLMAATAVHDTLLAACSLQTDIKWPNDLLVDEKKLCGILAETVETTTGRAAVVGIGINLTQSDLPMALAATATSIEAATGTIPDRAMVLQALVGNLTKHYEELSEGGGPAEIIRRWCALSSYCEGKLIRVVDGVEILEGITRGLERDGALRVETHEGKIKVLRAGDVSGVRPG